ncbi:MAG: creatininase family protein [Firmicutes bacterium]|jgi:creatinine amidohydrolase|nr:creatininase family protein [Bacillota bacterium]
MSASERHEVLVEHMTWPEVRDRLREGWDTAVFGVGAVEQHGPHLPIITDALLGTEVAVGVARALGKALAWSSIRPGFSPHHMDFPGTVTLRHETLVMIMQDYVRSLVRHGFRRIVIICAHGGNAPTVRLGCRQIQEEVGDRAVIIPIFDTLRYASDTESYIGLEEGFHANRIETSWVLHLAPHLVKMDRAVRDGVYPKVGDLSVVLSQGSLRDLAPSGALGDGTKGDAKFGRVTFERVCRKIAEEVEALTLAFRKRSN